MVSGSHFFPKAPLLWVKWIPAWAVMSRKVNLGVSICSRQSDDEPQRHRDTKEFRDNEFL